MSALVLTTPARRRFAAGSSGRGFVAARVLLALSACAHAAPPAQPKPAGFGLRKSAPAEVCLPPGEQLWLSRLRCPGGEPLQIVSHEPAGTRNEPDAPDDPRLLSQLDAGRRLAPGETDLHLLDAVTVSCKDGDHLLFVDTFHCAVPPPTNPPDGFTIQPLPVPDGD